MMFMTIIQFELSHIYLSLIIKITYNHKNRKEKATPRDIAQD